MSKKLQMTMVALGLTMMIAFVGCSNDDDSGPTITPPNAPSNVQASETEPGVVTVSWTESALDEAPDGYAIERRVNGGDWSEIGSVEAGVAMYEDDTVVLGSGNNYTYQIGAYNNGGTTWSLSTASVTVRTFKDLLVGIWDADETILFNEIQADSAAFFFNSNDTYRYVEYYEDAGPLDTEIWEEGTFTATGTAITFMASENDGGAIDTTYSWEYTENFIIDQIIVSHDYNDGSTYEIPYDKVIVITAD